MSQLSEHHNNNKNTIFASVQNFSREIRDVHGKKRNNSQQKRGVTKNIFYCKLVILKCNI